MTIDPSDYDLSELRLGADDGNGNGDEDPVLGRESRRSGDAGRGAPGPGDRSRSRSPRRGSGGAGEGGGDGTRPRDIARENLFEELAERQHAAAPSALERPYLTRVPDAYVGVEVVFEWLDYLIRRAGEPGAREALDYYERVGWISEGANEELCDYLGGINPGTTGDDDLGIDDHRISFGFVTRLAVLAARE